MRIRMTVGMGLVGCKRVEMVEVDQDDWEDMDEKERNEYMLEALFDILDWSYDEEPR
jgi:hypothetical protein